MDGDERSVSHFGHSEHEEFSTSFIAEIKKVWILTSTRLYVFMPWCVIKHRDSFISYVFQQTVNS
jgi:hypothetical protein